MQKILNFIEVKVLLKILFWKFLDTTCTSVSQDLLQ